MENIRIKGFKGVYYIPTVDFDSKTGICILSGESFLEDTEEFYQPLFDWLELYMNDIGGPVVFNFSLSYYNSSSSRSILQILKSLKKYHAKGGTVEVNWYLKEDLDLIEEIEDFEIESDLKINVIPSFTEQ